MSLATSAWLRRVLPFRDNPVQIDNVERLPWARYEVEKRP
jgi:hypothetical protein